MEKLIMSEQRADDLLLWAETLPTSVDNFNIDS